MTKSEYKSEYKFEDYMQSWNLYCKQLNQDVSCNQRMLEGIVKQKTILYQNRLLYQKLLMLVFCLFIVIYLITNISLFLMEIRNAIPFFLVLILFVFSIIGYGKYLIKLRKVSKYNLEVVDFATNTCELQLYEKREMLLSFFIALPILLLTLPQIFSVLFERKDYYSNIMSHLPILIIGCLLSICVGYIIYRKNYALIDGIKNNINTYKSIN